MYKEKLQSQLELLEEMQQEAKIRGEVAVVIELSGQIVNIAKEIDKVDKTMKVTISIDGNEIYNKVCKLNEKYQKRHLETNHFK